MEPRIARVGEAADRARLLADFKQLFARAELDEPALLQELAQQVAAMTGDACTVRILSEDEQWLVPVAVHHPSPAVCEAIRAVMSNTVARRALGIWAPVIEERRSVRLTVPSDGEETLANSQQLAFMRSFPSCHVLAVPLLSQRRSVGGISLIRPAYTAFSADEEGFLCELAAAAGAFVERARSQAARQRVGAHGAETPLDALSGSLVHGAHNLLQLIAAQAELARAELCRGAAVDRALAELVGTARRASQLTQELLSRRSQRPASASAAPRAQSLNELLLRLERALRRMLGERVTLGLELAPDLAPCRFDAGQVEQVVLDLCLNARDAMPDGGRLTLSTANHSLGASGSAGSCVRLSVQDTGSGMSRSTLTRLFEPFFSTRPGGAGLGLFSARRIVQQSGGCITVDSAPGRGSTFSLYLPAEPASALPRERPRARPAQRGPARASLGLPHGRSRRRVR